MTKKWSYEKLGQREFFDTKYSQMTNWTPRSKEEKDILFKNYIVYIVDGKILGGFALSDLWNKNKILECLFSEKKWLGSQMINEYIKKQGNIFAYSHDEKFFLKNGFVPWNKKSRSGADLYIRKKDL